MAGTRANARGEEWKRKKTPNAQHPSRQQTTQGSLSSRPAPSMLSAFSIGVRRFLQCFWVVKNQSTNFGRPTLSGVVGLYPSNFFAFDMSAQVKGTSPGCSGNWLIFAF